MSKSETVFVGLSGGVDSSVAALRLKKQGHKVVGVFIKTWQPDFIDCNWEKERLDAMRIAARLDIPFLTCDAEEAYKTDVAEYMVKEYEAGRTPNPDVMCNRHVKFGVFLDFALKNGADKVATGHYAQILEKNGKHLLLRGADRNKDQSYFLWTVTNNQLSKTLFPIGNTVKEAVRTEAAQAGLLTANKADSQGVCFLGHIDIQDFLSHYVEAKEGSVVDERGTIVGSHNGALFYTIGQRHGFSITKTSTETLPHYIVGKDIKKNLLIVSEKQPTVDSGAIILTTINQTNGIREEDMYLAQCRYRQTPFQVQVTKITTDQITLTIAEQTDTPSAGQSCVLYSGDICVGGGIIS